MSKSNQKSITDELHQYYFRMHYFLYSCLPSEKIIIFSQIHLCLALLLQKAKTSIQVEEIPLSIRDLPGSHQLAPIKLIYQNVDIQKSYEIVSNFKDASLGIDELTKSIVFQFKDYDEVNHLKLSLLEFFCETLYDFGEADRAGRASSDGISTKALVEFIENSVLNSSNIKSILFPHLQNPLLPLKFALLNPGSKVTAFEINQAKYSYAELLKFFFDLKSLKLINTLWLNYPLTVNNKLERFDKIINLAPMGLRLTPPLPTLEDFPPEFNSSALSNEPFEQQKTLEHIKDDGDGYLLTNRAFTFSDKNIFKFTRSRLLKNKNVSSVFKLPGGLLASTMIESVLFHFTKKGNEKVQFVDTSECFKTNRFQAEFSLINSTSILDAIKNRTNLKHRVQLINSEDLINEHSEIDPNRFVDNSEASQKRRRLLANYSDYEEVLLGSKDISKTIKRYSSIGDFKIADCVVIPRIPTKNLKRNPSISKIKPDSHIVELNTSRLRPGYLIHFLKSELGQLTLNLASRSAVIPTLTTKAVSALKIPLPSLAIQKNIETAFDKLEAVNLGISSISSEISSSPNDTTSLNSKLDEILIALDELTEPEKAFNKILQGEGELLEFKETFSLDVRRSKYDSSYKSVKEEKIEHSSLKTIAAFMNAKGGDLFIGVDDDALVTGVDEEIDLFHKSSLDKYLLHFNNKVQDRFDTPVIGMISVKPLTLSGKIVINIQVLPSKSDPIFLNEDFYVRSTPANEKLSGNGMYAYIKDRFSLK